MANKTSTEKLSEEGRVGRLLIFLIASFFLYLAYFNYEQFVSSISVRLVDTDPYYHIRRTWITVLRFPDIPTFDYYMAYPVGTVIHWPVGFDFVLATICRVFLGPVPGIYDVGRMSALLMPFFGVLNVILAYIVGRRFFGHQAGAYAALLAALSKSILSAGRVGHLDHHMLEPFFLLLTFYLFHLSTIQKNDSGFLKAALCLSASFLFFPSANIYPFLLAGYILLKGTRDIISGRGFDADFAKASKRVFALFTLFIVPVSLTSPLTMQGEFEFERLSLFQPFAGVYLLGLVFVFFYVWKYVTQKSLPSRYVFYVCALFVGLLLATPLNIPIVNAMRFMTRANPKELVTIETQSILMEGVSAYAGQYSNILYLLPLLFIRAIHWIMRSESDDRFMLSYLFLATMSLALVQWRFLIIFSLPFLIMLSAIVFDLHAYLQKKYGALQRRAIAVCLAGVLFVGPIAVSGHSIYKYLSANESGFLQKMGTMFDNYVWLSENTPPTSYLSEPEKKPEYAVLASWEYGHFITFFAERPNVANPFGLGEELGRVADFYTDLNEESAYRHARGLGVKYIMLTEENLAVQMLYLNRSGSELVGPKKDKGTESKKNLNERYYKTMASRLYYINGSAMNIEGFNIDGLGRFRLMYESKWMTALKGNDKDSFSYGKIFEVVEGMRIYGTTAPSSEISATLPVTTNRGNRFLYHMRTSSAKDGSYEMRVPYPTASMANSFTITETYKLSSEGEVVEISASEDEVQHGAARRVDFQPNNK